MNPEFRPFCVGPLFTCVDFVGLSTNGFQFMIDHILGRKSHTCLGKYQLLDRATMKEPVCYLELRTPNCSERVKVGLHFL